MPFIEILSSGDMSGTDVYYYLEHGKRLERPSRCPSSIYRVMLDCWQWDEKKRPTFSQLVQVLRTDAEQLETKKSTSISNSSTLPRPRALKPTSSSSTLTDENTPNGDFDDDDDDDENYDDDEDQGVSNKEQYRGNGNGHSLRRHRSFARDRIKS